MSALIVWILVPYILSFSSLFMSLKTFRAKLTVEARLGSVRNVRFSKEEKVAYRDLQICYCHPRFIYAASLFTDTGIRFSHNRRFEDTSVMIRVMTVVNTRIILGHLD